MASDDRPEYYAVMFNADGHISMTRSDGKPTPCGTKKYHDLWTVVATDMTDADARAYVRMNWRDMTPYSLAKDLRANGNPKYKHLSDVQFEALWHRQTLEEFQRAKPAFLAKEAEEKEEKEKQKQMQKVPATGA